MQIRQNQSFSAQTLRTHRHLFWECWGVVLLGVLLWLLEFFAAALLLRIQGTPPASLLTEQAVLWRIVQACWLVPAWLAWTVCRWRLWYHCTGAVSLLPRCRPAGTGKRLVLALQNTLLRTLLLQTVTLCLFGAYQLGQTAAHRTEGVMAVGKHVGNRELFDSAGPGRLQNVDIVVIRRHQRVKFQLELLHIVTVVMGL